MSKYTGTHKRPTVYKRGDTISPFSLKVYEKNSNIAIVPASVCCQLRGQFDNLVHAFDVDIGLDGTVTIGEISADISRTLDAGIYKYDVEYTLIGGRVITYLTGTLRIEEDVSRCE